MGGVGGMGHPMPLYTGGSGGGGNNKQMSSSGGGGGFGGGGALGARGRLTHPAAHTAAVLALNSGSDGCGNSPSKLVTGGGDGNISAPEKDEDDFWD